MLLFMENPNVHLYSSERGGRWEVTQEIKTLAFHLANWILKALSDFMK